MSMKRVERVYASNENDVALGYILDITSILSHTHYHISLVVDNTYGEDTLSTFENIDIKQSRKHITTLIIEIVRKLSTVDPNLIVHISGYNLNNTDTLSRIILEQTGVTSINKESIGIYNNTVLTISQCLGFDYTKTGTVIIPTLCHKLSSVHNNIIHLDNQKMYSQDDIEPIINSIKASHNLSINIIKGPLLVGNNEWVWKKKKDEYLLLNREHTNLLNFVINNTQCFDESHDWRHAVEVALIATKILPTSDCLKLALLHDVCDHKYPNAMPRENLSSYLCDIMDMERIDSMIDRVSYSYENTLRLGGISEIVEPELRAVRDADRLTAIGYRGLERCIQFTVARNGRVPDDVVQHCYDKLLRLVPENFITLRNQDVIDAHNVILDYVYSHKLSCLE